MQKREKNKKHSNALWYDVKLEQLASNNDGIQCQSYRPPSWCHPSAICSILGNSQIITFASTPVSTFGKLIHVPQHEPMLTLDDSICLRNISRTPHDPKRLGFILGWSMVVSKWSWGIRLLPVLTLANMGPYGFISMMMGGRLGRWEVARALDRGQGGRAEFSKTSAALCKQAWALEFGYSQPFLGAACSLTTPSSSNIMEVGKVCATCKAWIWRLQEDLCYCLTEVMASCGAKHLQHSWAFGACIHEGFPANVCNNISFYSTGAAAVINRYFQIRAM